MRSEHTTAVPRLNRTDSNRSKKCYQFFFEQLPVEQKGEVDNRSKCQQQHRYGEHNGVTVLKNVFELVATTTLVIWVQPCCLAVKVFKKGLFVLLVYMRVSGQPKEH